jgi:GNAT superfamily N-acetyltransferase
MFQNLDRALFVAEMDGQAVGIVLLELRTEPALPMLVPMRSVSVAEIVVGKNFQKKGVGHALMEQAKTWAKQHGAKDLRLSVAAFNRTARDFYAKEGFAVKHEVMAFPLDLPQ